MLGEPVEDGGGDGGGEGAGLVFEGVAGAGFGEGGAAEDAECGIAAGNLCGALRDELGAIVIVTDHDLDEADAFGVGVILKDGWGCGGDKGICLDDFVGGDFLDLEDHGLAAVDGEDHGWAIGVLGIGDALAGDDGDAGGAAAE